MEGKRLTGDGLRRGRKLAKLAGVQAASAQMGNKTVVQVAVPRPLRRTFDYAAPAGEPPLPGVRVRVPFGRASVVGLVTSCRETSARALKAVTEVLDEQPLLPGELIDLACWLARYYHYPIGAVYAAMLPVKARQGAVAKPIDEVVWRALDVGPDQAVPSRAPRQRQALARLRELGGVADSELAALGIDRRHLAPLHAKGLVERAVVTPDYHQPRVDAAVQPTPAQAAAVAAVAANPAATHLLDGVTGSGKTEVYLGVIAEVLRAGGQALVLVPEIALTPQTTARFKARFGAAATLHSAASDTQRFDTWLKCASGVHKVLIGTRSAVLTPFAKLGVIVVDEEHDGSFKQYEGLRYSARDVAVKRGRMLSIPVLLGSATPSLESLRNVRRGRYHYARLDDRAGGASMPTWRVVDVRGVRLDRGISPLMHTAIDHHLAAGNQVLAFINRRGYAPVLFCPRCAWRAQCDHCDAKLICHHRSRRLRCHHCGGSSPAPSRCPGCGGDELIPLGAGTQRVEEALAERHPGVPLYRIDRDTARGIRRLEADLAAIRAGAPSILVGTQMLAKGHHLPGVTLVAVLDIDSGFLSSDFRAPERTAQLVVQVAGRAGRADQPGQVWIQTRDPANPNLRALLDSGYRGFAASERAVRAAAGMPPFASLAIIRSEGAVRAAPEKLLADAALILAGDGVEVLGPAPAPIARRADRYRYQLLVLAGRRADLHRALDRLERAEPRATGVRWSIDVDPLDTF